MLALDATPAPLAENVAVGDTVGKIRFLGMLVIPRISINGLRLSQLSDIAWDENAGVLYAISDKGGLFHLHPIWRDNVLVDVKLSRAVPLRDLATGKPLQDRHADAEGLDILPNPSGRAADTELIISFERYPRIVRYHTDGYAVGEYTLPAPLNNPKAYVDTNRMLEATCHYPQFGVLTIPELPLDSEAPGYNRLYTLSEKSWRYPIEDGNRVVGLSCLANGDVLVLEGTFGSRFWRSHTTLKRVRPPNAPTTAPLQPELLVTLEPTKGYQIDNFEGIAHHRGKRFFLISDDNDFFLQRTLLLYIELVD
ncbi:MAG: hypothetical protein A2W18_01725 [Candidatus Muproteobacteria bacterium RBG_16_60_9]|uniref:Phytase-like domain-containing protein n=1 Tax=Candidatus Muproteobacteria bacterium RBG_16_60_9 TaxID=1817755 RepID=A0A1F6VAM4_9PROT|nr:MAG: hypothetical protein A2W18_01725 [Candidatus Muproteobacteria bacterium RBG_16_60_9]